MICWKKSGWFQHTAGKGEGTEGIFQKVSNICVSYAVLRYAAVEVGMDEDECIIHELKRN